MGILDSALQGLAQVLIGTFSDTSATYTRTPTPRYDASSGQEFAEPTTTYTIKIAPPQPYTKTAVNGTAVQARDLRTWVAAADLPIEADPRTDSLTWQGSTFQVITSTPIGTADGNVLIELQLRQ